MGYTYLESWVTFSCSCVSWLGSILVLCSYMVASTKSNVKAAQLIRNLALTDFLWFTCSIVMSTFWISDGGDGVVPPGVCYVVAPFLMYLRMASLLWTCAISFDVLMSVKKRNWFGDHLEWQTFRQKYYMIVYLLPFPGAFVTIVQNFIEKAPLGCDAGYEPIGSWALTFFTELLPITLGFICNIFIFMQVRSRMALKAFPQSVRKRRRLVMYHYMVVCIVCWTPTIFFYIAEIVGIHNPALELTARTSLYLTGLLNFIVFGMQDPHLKRSFQLVLFKLGCNCLLPAMTTHMVLKSSEVDKNVFFEEATISSNADISKDKKNIYRHHKLSKSEKARLYKNRPDLDPENGSCDSLLGDKDKRRRKKSSRRRKREEQERSSKDSADSAEVTTTRETLCDEDFSDSSSCYSSDSGSDFSSLDDDHDRLAMRIDSNDLARSRFRDRLAREEAEEAEKLTSAEMGLNDVTNDCVTSRSNERRISIDGSSPDSETGSSNVADANKAWGAWTPSNNPPPRQELLNVSNPRISKSEKVRGVGVKFEEECVVLNGNGGEGALGVGTQECIQGAVAFPTVTEREGTDNVDTPMDSLGINTSASEGVGSVSIGNAGYVLPNAVPVGECKSKNSSRRSTPNNSPKPTSAPLKPQSPLRSSRGHSRASHQHLKEGDDQTETESNTESSEDEADDEDIQLSIPVQIALAKENSTGGSGGITSPLLGGSRSSSRE